MKSLRAANALALAALLLSLSIGLVSCLSSGSTNGTLPSPSPTPAPDDIYSLISKGDMGGLKGMLKSKELVNSPNAAGDYPLHLAVRKGDVDIATFLLAMGAAVDPRDASGRTPLKLSADLGSAPLVALFSSKGADIFAADQEKLSPVDVALKSPLALLPSLLTRDNVNSVDASGRTVLHRAADAGIVDAARIALDLAPDVNKKDAEGKTALDGALLRPQSLDCARVAELLVQKGGSTFMPDFGWFVRAARDGDYNSRRFEDGNAPLHEAVSRNQRGFIQFLIEKKVDLNARNGAGEAALHMAARSGYAEAAKILLDAGADPDARDSFDNTPLMLSMPAGERHGIVQLLISRGASANAKDKNGNTPLHVAAMLSWPASDAELLLKAGALVDPGNAAGDTPLMLAVQKGNADLISLLLTWKANMFALNGKKDTPLLAAFRMGPAAAALLVNKDTVNIRDDQGMTPLMTAVRSQDSADVVRMILSAGADVNARSNSGDTALHMAVRRGRADMGTLLLGSGADIFAANMSGEIPLTLALSASDGSGSWMLTPDTIRARDKSGDTVLHFVARLGLAAQLPLVLSKGADIDARNAAGETPLAAAVKADASASVKALIAMKANAALRDALGNTALHLAVEWNAAKSLPLLAGDAYALRSRNLSGKTPFHEACRRDNLDFASLLLSKGADPDARDGSGLTALMDAVDGNRLDTARFLLSSAKASPLVRDDSGDTALHLAVRARNAAACKLLLDAGADIHARNSLDETPLLLALAYGPDGLPLVIDDRTVNRQDAEGRGPLAVAILSKAGAAVVSALLADGASTETRDSSAETPLLAALRMGELDVVPLLVRAGADIWARNAQSQTPFQLALSAGMDALKALLAEAGANRADYLGNTPLHAAALSGSAEAVDYLLSAGADKSLANLAGETAADVAAKRGFSKIAAELR